MVRLSSPRHATRALAALSLLAATACTDTAVSPTAGISGTLDYSATGLVLHHGKYRDSSRPNATGRSGAATLSARAVLDSMGVTHLYVASGSIYEEGVDGELVKVQVKAWAPDSTQIFTQNFVRFTTGGEHEFLLTGVPAGSRFQVQANVRGIDRNRTDVVTASGTVARESSVSTHLVPPPPPVPGVPTVITSTVREDGGDMGTTVTCVLYVDGVRVDNSGNVWVDAGDEVTCAFTYVFPGPGSYDVRVVLVDEDGNPRASDSETVVVQDSNPQPRWAATVLDRTVSTHTQYDENWWNPDGSHKEYERAEIDAVRSQTVAVTATLARATSFPLASVGLRMTSDAGGTLQTGSWSGLTETVANGQTCVNRLVPEHGGHFTLCSTGTGFTGSTTFGYTRFAGTVTYHSRGFTSTWFEPTAVLDAWTWNDEYTTHQSGGQMRDLGTSVGIQLSIADGEGDYAVNATVPLRSFDNVLAEVPYTCNTYTPYWVWGGEQTICTASLTRETGWRGEAGGAG